MTPERKEYLASISQEERAIRQALAEEKGLISLCKNELNRICFSKRNTTYKMLNTSKTRIKALKKQLPAPKEQYLHWVDYCPNCLEKISNEANYCQNCGRQLFQYVCPICKVSTEFRQDYCCKCGQKLR